MPSLPVAPILAVAANGAAGADGDLARALLADPHYQKRLTDPALDWSIRLPSVSFKLPFLAIAVPGWVVMLALALLVAAVAWLLLRRLVRPKREADTAEADAPRAAAAPNTLARARELGEAGLHLEAVHLLLLVAVEHWTRNAPAAVHPDQTSRELLRSLPASLPSERREALAALVRAVEWCWFGGRPAGRAEYERALRSCSVFLGESA
ncbi:MAG TPA: DUF4129 domain-containing protein [Methylomirabilota bacterium]|nr:DUF4129 domain-containing protein [Methylomirabilota bacterium]